MPKPGNIYIHKGTPGCKGKTRTQRVGVGGAPMLHMTCSGCPLDWFTADTSAKAVRGS